jgi:hypothetical protein
MIAEDFKQTWPTPMIRLVIARDYHWRGHVIAIYTIPGVLQGFFRASRDHFTKGLWIISGF